MKREITIKHGRFTKLPLGETDVLFGVVRGDAFRDIDLPLTPNPRKPLGARNKNYLSMIHTISNEPELFVFKNGGITLFAERFTCHDNGDVTVVLDDERDGIANGGHSYTVAKAMGSDKIHIKMQIVSGLRTDKLTDIAAALNQSKRLEVYSLENARGEFDWHKQLLGDLSASICYHEGDSGLTDVRESIGALHVFLYGKDGRKNPVSCYRGSTNVNHHALVKFRKEEYAKQVAAIARDVHTLQRHIVRAEHALALCDMTHMSGWKRRLPTREFGLIRAVTNMVLLGVAVAGTQLDENGVVQWKQGYQTHSLRCGFADQMFQKLLDLILLEEGTPSVICKRESTIERAVRQAQMLDVRYRKQDQMALEV